MKILSTQQALEVTGGGMAAHATGIIGAVCISPVAMILAAFASDSPNNQSFAINLFTAIELGGYGAGFVVGSAMEWWVYQVFNSSNSPVETQ